MERKQRFSGFAVWIFISVMIVISSGALGNQMTSRSKQPVMYKMQIVPAISSSYDINSLAIQEDLATFYFWKWFYRAPAIGLWIVLALAILLVRENRDPRVLLIFIPIFLVRLLWFWFQ